ncbi:hypothetical protein EGM51_17805 [Verrucomicrobia bacterium S94]|nr:hypothetical protein EGM51_17805 [Verrucomicrobia bacterium S94]
MKLFRAFILCLVAHQAFADKAVSSRWTMHADTPANKWEDAFVTGNGRHGTMVMGRPGKEIITCVHEELFISAWDRDIVAVADIAYLLPEIRALIREGKPADAATLAVKAAGKELAPKGVTNNGWPVVPHPAFDLELEFKQEGETQNYRRELNLETGEAFSRWGDAGHQVEQRVFSSRAHNVNVVELRAPGSHKLDLSMRLIERPGRIRKDAPVYRNVEMNGAFSSISAESAPGWLFYHANYALDSGGYDGVARVTLDGGRMVDEGNGLRIQGADRVLIVIQIDPSDDGRVSQRKRMQAELRALPKDYAGLFAPHANLHREMFGRVTLDLGCGTRWQTDSIEKVLADTHQNGVNAHFLEMVHAMGRYLLISTSGKYPAPLQGIWGAAGGHDGAEVLRPIPM